MVKLIPLVLLLLTSTLHAEEIPVANAQTDPRLDPKYHEKHEPLGTRLEYSHSIGNPNYHAATAQGLSYGLGSVGSLTLNFALNKEETPFYFGIGYQWQGALTFYGAETEQSGNKAYLQLGKEFQAFSFLTVAPRIGASIQYFPGFLSTHPDSTIYPNDVQFQDGIGYKVYAGLHFLQDLWGSIGFQYFISTYKNGSANPDQNDFYLSHSSFFLTFGSGF